MLFSKNSAYLIDSENVGSTWTSLLSKEKVELYIFVTANAKSLNYTLLKEITENKHKNSYKVIECEVGKNSLDFYISSYLGYLIGKNNNSDYTIVSQDKGYDNVIEFWKTQGIEVKKINTKPEVERKRRILKRPAIQRPRKTVSAETRSFNKKEEPAVKADPSYDFLKRRFKETDDKDIERIRNVLDSVSSKESKDVYVALVKEFKQEDGLKHYNTVKRSLKKYYSLSDEKKEVNG